MIVLADDDILVGPEWLSQLVAPFRRTARTGSGSSGGRWSPSSPTGSPPGWQGAHRPLGVPGRPGAAAAGPGAHGSELRVPEVGLREARQVRHEPHRQGGRLFGGGDSEMIRRVRAAGLEAWFVPGARALHQMPADRLTLGYALRHAFDSARSRVVDQVRLLRASGRSPLGFLASRAAAAALKLAGPGARPPLGPRPAHGGRQVGARARRTGWSCGYLYQIARSAAGKT